MNLDKVAVFATSDIFCVWRQGAVTCSEMANIYWARTKKYELPTGEVIFSTDRLERAVEGGFTCFVASTRSGLSSHDQWWVDIVGRDNVFLANVYDTSAGWIKLYERLDLPYPQEGGRPVFWTAADHLLRTKVSFGHTFVGDLERAHKKERDARIEGLKFWSWLEDAPGAFA